MNWFWHAVWICLVVIPVTILWIICITDIIFNRNDLVWWKRLGVLLLVLVPFIGPIAYAFMHPIFHGQREDVYEENGERDFDEAPIVASGEYPRIIA